MARDISSSDEDTPLLSEHALAALREFYEEQDALEEKRSQNDKASFQENWVCHVGGRGLSDWGKNLSAHKLHKISINFSKTPRIIV